MITPIAALGAKAAVDPIMNIAGNILDTKTPSTQTASPGFQKELMRGSSRSGEVAMPVDHELLSLCSAERQKQFGSGIMGRSVQVVDAKGQVLSGRVDKVWMEDNQLHFQAAGQAFSIANLRAVYQNPPEGLRGMTPTQGGAK